MRPRDDAQVLVQRLFDSAGLIVMAKSQGRDRRATTLVPWLELLAHKGAVTAAMNAMVVEAGRKWGES